MLELDISEGEFEGEKIESHVQKLIRQKAHRSNTQLNNCTNVVDDFVLLPDLKKEFAYFDKDMNGTISVIDFGSVIRGQGYNPSEKELLDMTSQYDSEGKSQNKTYRIQFIYEMHKYSNTAIINTRSNTTITYLSLATVELHY